MLLTDHTVVGPTKQSLWRQFSDDVSLIVTDAQSDYEAEPIQAFLAGDYGRRWADNDATVFGLTSI